MASPVLAGSNLVKSAVDPAVYYLDGNNVRHLFPTRNTYMTWYDDFAGVATLSLGEITKYPLGKNVTVRPGKKIVTFATDPNFYAVEPGGVLRRLADEWIIEGIYGSDWRRRVMGLLDVTFDDYLMGEPIKKDYDVPDGTVYKLAGRYFYKRDNLLWPFKDLNSVKANGYGLYDVVNGDINFNQRRQEITGLNNLVFNPAEEPRLKNNDCENEKLKVAFILTTKGFYTPEQIQTITAIKEQFKTTFNWATKELAQVDVSFPLAIISGNEFLLTDDQNGQAVPDNEVINVFLDNNLDIFDFIVLYNNFVLTEPIIANYVNVTNNFSGTGNTTMDLSELYGSRGKLKGILNMGNVSKYNSDTAVGLDSAVDYILHELGHHWSGRAVFEDSYGNIRKSLLEKPDYYHWNMYVDFISPMGGSGWQDNDDGTYTNKRTLVDNSIKKQYSDLDLYFMSLLPKPYVQPVKYLVPENGARGATIRGEMKEVTIGQITKVLGGLSCTAK